MLAVANVRTRPKPTGRSSEYTEEMGILICERLAAGESLRSICRDESMPSAATIYAWLVRNESFLKLYRESRDIQADLWAEEVRDLPYECEALGLDAAYTKLKMDGNKWAASKGNPTKYGDRVEHAGAIETVSSTAMLEAVGAFANLLQTSAKQKLVEGTVIENE